MYAIFEVGGFQFRGEEGAVLQVPHRKLGQGDKLDIAEVLLVQQNDNVLVGTPYVEGAKIEAEVVQDTKADKIRIYKYKRRTKYRRRAGHRQQLTEIKINKIVTP